MLSHLHPRCQFVEGREHFMRILNKAIHHLQSGCPAIVGMGEQGWVPLKWRGSGTFFGLLLIRCLRLLPIQMTGYGMVIQRTPQTDVMENISSRMFWVVTIFPVD